MRIETYRRIFSFRNGVIAFIIFHLVVTILMATYVNNMTFLDAIGVALIFDLLFFIILVPIWDFVDGRILKSTIQEDRKKNNVEYRYEYEDFNGEFWTIVKRKRRWSVHEDWETQYNLINREGALFFNLYCDYIGRVPVPNDMTGFYIEFNSNTNACNLLLCDGYMNKDTNFLVDTDVQRIGSFDKDGMAQVTYLDESINYIDVKGKKLYPQNLVGYVPSQNLE